MTILIIKATILASLHREDSAPCHKAPKLREQRSQELGSSGQGGTVQDHGECPLGSVLKSKCPMPSPKYVRVCDLGYLRLHG